MSAILFIKKIFGHIRPYAYIIYTLLIVSILYGVVVFLEIFLICRPMAVDWNASINGTCGNQIVSYLVLEAFGLLLDLTILITPIWAIWRSQMSRAQKISVSILFSLGFL